MSTIRFMHSYIRRVIDQELDDLFVDLPAILLDGPKGVGKTRTAVERCTDGSIRRLDLLPERQIMEADPFIIRTDSRPTLIDEWQRVPAVFDVVRRLVDEDGVGGQFLLTGSAPWPHATHSGAGRIVSMRMRPLTLQERLGLNPTVSMRELLTGSAVIAGSSTLTLADYTSEIVAGGFPGMQHLTPRARSRQLDGYINRIVDHDLPELGTAVRHPERVLGWLRAYGAATSTITQWDKIRNAATPGEGDKPSKPSTMVYRELLTQLRILDPLEGWGPSNNHLKNLTLSPKHHLTDPALAARLVKLSATKLLAGDGPSRPVPGDGTYLGALFESLVALSVRTYAQLNDARVYHMRTGNGRHEIDFIVESDDGILAIEAKLTPTVDRNDVAHLKWLKEHIGSSCKDLMIVTTGLQAYRRTDGVAVVPLATLGA